MDITATTARLSDAMNKGFAITAPHPSF